MRDADDLNVRWGFLDSVLEVVTPVRAARRYQARVAVETLRRAYDGAAKSSATDGWRTARRSADAEISATGGLLRDRMRDLVRNDALAAQAVQVLVNNIVGTGIRPRANTGNNRTNKRVDALWRAFSVQCDFHGQTDFHGLTALAVREMIEGGEALVLRRFQRAGSGLAVPLTVELRESDHLDDGKRAEGVTGNRIASGIEYDSGGRRVAYWMFPDHPGGTSTWRRFSSERVPASEVAHLFERQRVQSRGVPWGVAAMRAMRDFGDWQRAELARKKAEACLVAFVIGEDSDVQGGVAPTVKNGKNENIEQMKPGMIAYVTGGREVKLNTPGAANGIREWTRAQMHLIAAGFRVPYALMTGDMAEANFASSRVGLNEFRRMVEQVQWQTVIPMFCQPVWDWFVEAARTAGQLPEGGPISCEWAPPKFESVNPLQDVQADILEVRSGFSTRPQKIAARGYDPVSVTEEWAADAVLTDGLGLVFDADPRRVSKAGGFQAGAPAGDQQVQG